MRLLEYNWPFLVLFGFVGLVIWGCCLSLQREAANQKNFIAQCAAQGGVQIGDGQEVCVDRQWRVLFVYVSSSANTNHKYEVLR